MKIAIKMNLWSFFSMLFCWLAFLIALSAEMPFNPHFLILFASITVLIFSVAGLSGITNYRSASRATVTIFGSIALCLIELWVVFFGALLS